MIVSGNVSVLNEDDCNLCALRYVGGADFFFCDLFRIWD